MDALARIAAVLLIVAAAGCFSIDPATPVEPTFDAVTHRPVTWAHAATSTLPYEPNTISIPPSR